MLAKSKTTMSLNFRWTIISTFAILATTLIPADSTANTVNFSFTKINEPDAISTSVSGVNTYFLNSSLGSDTNSGTSAGAAFRSLSRINQLDLNPGDTVVIAGNTSYTGTLYLGNRDAGTAAAPVT